MKTFSCVELGMLLPKVENVIDNLAYVQHPRDDLSSHEAQNVGIVA